MTAPGSMDRPPREARVQPRPIPAAFFGIVLGVAGLGNAWRAAYTAWGLPAAIGETSMAAAASIWAAFVILYVRKWVIDRDAVADELEQPVQCCFIGLIGVAIMLVAGEVLPYASLPAVWLFAAGALFSLGFAVWRTGGLWHGERDAAAAAVLYLPTVVKSFVTGIPAGALDQPDWGQFAFGAGLFSWLSTESILLHRLLTSHALADALRPTLGIQIAPAPVAALSYLSIGPGVPDIVDHALIGYGILQALVLLRLGPEIWKGVFSPSYWAFTFGSTALGAAPVKLVQHGDTWAMAVLAPILFVAASLLVLLVTVKTSNLALRGRLLPKPAT